MKKTIIVLALLLCACLLFASKNSVQFNLVPYGYQVLNSSAEADDSIKSTYGIGAELSYQRVLYKGLFVEAGIGWDTFLLKDKNPRAFTDIIVFGGLGLKCNFTSKLTAFVHADVAGDGLIYNKTQKYFLTLKGGVGFDYAVNDKFSALVKCDATYGFVVEGDKFSSVRVLPMIGAKYSF